MSRLRATGRATRPDPARPVRMCVEGAFRPEEAAMGASTRKAELPRVVAIQAHLLYLVETGETMPRLAPDVETGRIYNRQQRKLSEPLSIPANLRYPGWDASVDAETCVEVAAEVAALLDDGGAPFTQHPDAHRGLIPESEWLPMIPSDMSLAEFDEWRAEMAARRAST